MKNIIITILLFISFSGYSQNIIVSGFDSTTGRPGYKYTLKPTNFLAPLKLLNDSTVYADTSKAIGRLATFSDLALKQNLITLTTTGTSGVSTFTQSTGALNIPNYATGGGGLADSTYFWARNLNVVVDADKFGARNLRSVNMYANNIRYWQLDSLGQFNIFPNSGTFNAFTMYRNGSTTNYPFRLTNDASDNAVIKSVNNPIIFKTNYNAGTQLENFRLTESVVNPINSGNPQAIVTGKLQAKVTTPTGTNLSYGLQVSNTTPINRFGLGLDVNEDAVLGLNNVGFQVQEENAVSSTIGTFFRVFAQTGNVMIKNKGTYTQNLASRFSVLSDTGLLAQGSIPAPAMTTTERNGITTEVAGGTIVGGSGYTTGSYSVAMTGGTGVGAIMAVTVAGGVVSSATPATSRDRGRNYTIGDVLTPVAAFGGGTGFTYTITNFVIPTAGLKVYDNTLLKDFAWDGTLWTEMGKILSGSATLDFASTAAQTSSELTITVTGAADGDVCSVGIPNGSTNANSTFIARVSAANTVTVKFNNYSSGAIDPASGTFKVKVFKD